MAGNLFSVLLAANKTFSLQTFWLVNIGKLHGELLTLTMAAFHSGELVPGSLIESSHGESYWSNLSFSCCDTSKSLPWKLCCCHVSFIVCVFFSFLWHLWSSLLFGYCLCVSQMFLDVCLFVWIKTLSGALLPAVALLIKNIWSSCRVHVIWTWYETLIISVVEKWNTNIWSW